MSQATDTAPLTRSVFSYATGLSLVLPFYWLEVPASDYAAAYIKLPSGAVDFTTSLVVKIWRPEDVQPDSYQQVMEGSLKSALFPGYLRRQLRDFAFDGFPGRLHLFSWQPDPARPVLYQAELVAQVDQLIYLLVGTSHERADLELFEQIFSSIRFIPISK